MNPIQTTRTSISSITLPNGQSYYFYYESTYGLLSKIVYPDGGSVSYSWKLSETPQDLGVTAAADNAGACYIAYQVPVVATRTVSFVGGTSLTQSFGPYSTSWVPGSTLGWTGRTNTVSTTDPVLGTKQTQYTYTPMLQPVQNAYSSIPPNNVDYSAVESEVQDYDWGNNSAPLKTEYKSWVTPTQLLCDFEELNNSGVYAGVFYQYSPLYNKVTDKREYDWGQVNGASACYNNTQGTLPSVTPRRETTTSYQGFTEPTSYIVNTLAFGMPNVTAVYQNGDEQAETDIAYDQCSTQYYYAPQYDYRDYNPVTSLGNATWVTQKCLVSGCSDSTTTYYYDVYGSVIAKTDPLGYNP